MILKWERQRDDIWLNNASVGRICWSCHLKKNTSTTESWASCHPGHATRAFSMPCAWRQHGVEAVWVNLGDSGHCPCWLDALLFAWADKAICLFFHLRLKSHPGQEKGLFLCSSFCFVKATDDIRCKAREKTGFSSDLCLLAHSRQSGNTREIHKEC